MSNCGMKKPTRVGHASRKNEVLLALLATLRLITSSCNL